MLGRRKVYLDLEEHSKDDNGGECDKDQLKLEGHREGDGRECNRCTLQMHEIMKA